MANTFQKILLAGNYENYKKLPVKDANTLYFCEDVGKIFKGEVDYSDHIIVADTKPSSPITGKLYILSDTDTVEAYVNNAWKVISYPLTTIIDEDSDDLHAITAKAVYDALQKITQGMVEGVVTNITLVEDTEVPYKPATLHLEYDNDPKSPYNQNILIPGVALEPKWDSAARTLTIPVTPVNGASTAEDVVINFPKDIFLDTNKDNGYNAVEKSIDLYLNDASENGGTPTLVRVPIADLVDCIQTITGGNGKGTTSNIDVNGVLNVDLVLDPDSNNALSLSSDGLMLDLSGYVVQADFDDLVETVDNLADATTTWGTF